MAGKGGNSTAAIAGVSRDCEATIHWKPEHRLRRYLEGGECDGRKRQRIGQGELSRSYHSGVLLKSYKESKSGKGAFP